MRFFFFSELNSTSSWAAEKIRAEQAIQEFCVVAGEQTQGRGRSGHVWESKPGGLYLTLCMPTRLETLRKPGAITLEVGAIVADYIQLKFGLRVSLKWPNDLYFNGLKIGGILTESIPLAESKAEPMVMLLVGIGLNFLNHVEKKQGRIALKDVLPETLLPINDCKSWAEEFIGYFAPAFRQNLKCLFQGKNWHKRVRTGFRLWWDLDTGALMRLVTIKDTGEMVLKGVFDEKKKVFLQSSHHRHVPFALQANGNIKLWLIDQGNTSSKIYSCIFDSPIETFGIPRLNLVSRLFHDQLEEAWDSFVNQHLEKYDQNLFFIASVNKECRLHLCDLINKRSSCRFIKIQKIPVKIRTQYAVQELGIDRLAIMEGAIAAKENPNGLLLASSGTAVTVDVVAPGNLHLGGWICPGFDLQLESMHRSTSLLPRLKMDEAEFVLKGNLLGTSTESSMRSGVFQSLTLAIENLQNKLHTEYGIEFVIKSLGSWPDSHNHNDIDQDLMPLGLWTLIRG